MFEKQYPQITWKEIEVRAHSFENMITYTKRWGHECDRRPTIRACPYLSYNCFTAYVNVKKNTHYVRGRASSCTAFQICKLNQVTVISECSQWLLPVSSNSLLHYDLCLLSATCTVFVYISQAELFKAFKELFMAATSRPPPYGICPYPSSRAIYAVDLMLKWSTGQNGEGLFIVCIVPWAPVVLWFESLGMKIHKQLLFKQKKQTKKSRNSLNVCIVFTYIKYLIYTYNQR